jgi:hypothetical protein
MHGAEGLNNLRQAPLNRKTNFWHNHSKSGNHVKLRHRNSSFSENTGFSSPKNPLHLIFYLDLSSNCFAV